MTANRKTAYRKETVIFLLLLALLLASCATETSADVDNAPAGEQVAAVSTTQATPTPAPTSAAADLPTPPAVDECLNCHVDKERLIDTAAPEEEVIVENEGEG